MRCKECGELARNPTLRFCENCGATMPLPPPRGTASRSASPGTGSGRAIPSPEEEQPRSPPYEGPAWLAQVPGHSPSVAGIGLVALALVLSILPLFAGPGPLWGLVTLAGGGLVVARELRAAGEQHPLVDWVPPTLLGPVVPAVYAVVVAALAVRMLGVGLTPLLWLGGAGLLVHDQYRKVYAGPEGWSRLFEPRQWVRGTTPVALGGVAICLLALFLTWSPLPTSPSHSAPVPRGPPQLQVVDAPRTSSDEVYDFFVESTGAGWELPLAVWVELLLLGTLAVLALRPEVRRPEWLRLVPVGAVVLGFFWGLAHLRMLPGPLLFLGGLGAVGFVAVQQMLVRD
jgi:hypothetical protein